MFRKIIKIVSSLSFCLGLFFLNQNVQAESLLKSDQSLQIIKIYPEDFNHWIEVPNFFTSLAVESNQPLDLNIFFNPQSLVSQKINFEENQYSELTFTNPSKYFLIKNNTLESKSSLTVYLFDTRQSSASPNYSASTVLLNGLRVISRQEWGADETLRYKDPNEKNEEKAGTTTPKVTACDKLIEAYPHEYKYASTSTTENGNLLKWPLQYSPNIKKIIVHHTGETDVTNSRPSDEMVRAIYYYHTIVRGWGDIGYHYIIGKDGEIFEGKAGGDKIVGAHVYCNNIGTIGVSVMGNFENISVSTKQINGLKAILAKLTQKYNLEPDGNSMFHGKFTPNILGHKDLAPTACPGRNLYSLLSEVRQDVARGFTYQFVETANVTHNKDYDAEISKDVSILKLPPTHTKTLTFKFKNTGKQPWNQDTWLHVALNNNTNAWADSIVPDKKFVAADMKEEEVKPGETANFEVTLNAGYKAGFYILEFAPVVNNKYKLSKSALLQPIEIDEPNYSYTFVKAEHPPNPFYTQQSAEASLQLKNTGNIVWRNYGENKIYLGTTGPQDRPSLFSSDGRRTRLGYLKEREVKPGETGEFVMPMIAPERRGIYKEGFAPVIEGIHWLEDKDMNFRIIVKEPQYKIKFTSTLNDILLDPGAKLTYNLSYENLSDVNWSKDQIFFRLAGNYNLFGIEENNLMLDTPVEKNKTGTSKLYLQAPLQSGTHKITIIPVIRGKKFKEAEAFTLNINVKKPILDAKLINTVPKTLNLNRQEEKTITINIKNTGNFIWEQNSILLVANNPKSRLYVSDTWIDKNIVTSMLEKSVAPGNVATFQIKLKPKYRGIFFEIFKLKTSEGTFIRSISLPLRIFVEMDQILKPQISTKTPSTNTPTPQTQSTSPAPTSNNSPNTLSQSKQNNIRIRLSVPNSDQHTITADQNYKIWGDNNNELFIVSKNTPVLIKKSGNFLNLQVGGQNKVSQTIQIQAEKEGIVEISSWEHRPAWNQTLNDNRFRGILELQILDNAITFINELPLEDYLKGIAEVSNSDPTEKQKTMAVIARSYAKFYLDPTNIKFPGKPYHGSDDPNQFQKYLGYNLELRSPNFLEAVKNTTNQVVTYQNKLIKTPYFNQSDGRTLSAKEVWGWENTPYLISVDDPYCQGLKRNGHGVGLSGFGATQMAKNGKTYQEIIKYYYQGVEIQSQ